MPTVESILNSMSDNPENVRFSEVMKVTEHFFGKPRIKGSHYIFQTPWKGSPRINLQNRKDYVHEYQVKQVVAAIEMLTGEKHV